MHTVTRNNALLALRKALCSYYPISDGSWSALKAYCLCRTVDKKDLLYRAGEIPLSYAFVYSGLFRVYSTDEKGNEYNRNFFAEGSFPGSMRALLSRSPSEVSIEALEYALVVQIDFSGYRRLLEEKHDLTLFQVHYMEKNWLFAKDVRETEIVQLDATQRYQRFIQHQPLLANRLPQYHIASHLGITPTQLSRIRKKL